jgi:hypothetical protein
VWLPRSKSWGVPREVSECGRLLFYFGLVPLLLASPPRCRYCTSLYEPFTDATCQSALLHVAMGRHYPPSEATALQHGVARSCLARPAVAVHDAAFLGRLCAVGNCPRHVQQRARLAYPSPAQFLRVAPVLAPHFHDPDVPAACHGHWRRHAPRAPPHLYFPQQSLQQALPGGLLPQVSRHRYTYV